MPLINLINLSVSDLEFAAISCLTRWSEDDLAVRRLIKLMLEDDKPSEKRANFVSPNENLATRARNFAPVKPFFMYRTDNF